MEPGRYRGDQMVKLYVEGGGDSSTLKTACRAGFSEFLRKAGLQGSMPRIVACGGRQDAYDSFCTAISSGEEALLLVDSEAPVLIQCQQGDDHKSWDPWQHLKNRPGDNWDIPGGAKNEDCHLMVQCMEAWFLADRASLKSFFGQGFNENALPHEKNKLESIAKIAIYKALSSATQNCKTKAPYGKGEHSFKLLALISPTMVCSASPWAERFVTLLKEKME